MDNELLASLEASERDLLNLRDADLKSQQLLFEAGDQIDPIYFPRGSIISLVVLLSECHR